MNKSVTNPLFSIVIPTYNRAGHIKRSVESVLEQQFKSFEVIVVDDGSTDNTEEVVQGIRDKRLLYFKKVNGERGAARNYGIQRSSGAYVTFLDSDDRLYPHFFSVAKSFIEQNDQPAFFHSGYEIKNERGKVITKVKSDRGNLNLRLAKGNFLSCIGVFVRQDVIKEHLFNEDRTLAGSEDYELWMRIASRYPLLGVNKITAYMVHHSGRSVINFEEEKLIERIEATWKRLNEDVQVCKFYKEEMKTIYAHQHMYLALHLMLKGNKRLAFKYAGRAVEKDPSVFFTRKMLSLVYKGFIS